MIQTAVQVAGGLTETNQSIPSAGAYRDISTTHWSRNNMAYYKMLIVTYDPLGHITLSSSHTYGIVKFHTFWLASYSDHMVSCSSKLLVTSPCGYHINKKT